MRGFVAYAAACVAVVLFVAFVFYVFAWSVGVLFSDDDVDRFRANCIEAGGRLYEPEIVLCITEDGRIVEVYP